MYRALAGTLEVIVVAGALSFAQGRRAQQVQMTARVVMQILHSSAMLELAECLIG